MENVAVLAGIAALLPDLAQFGAGNSPVQMILIGLPMDDETAGWQGDERLNAAPPDAYRIVRGPACRIRRVSDRPSGRSDLGVIASGDRVMESGLALEDQDALRKGFGSISCVLAKRHLVDVRCADGDAKFADRQRLSR